MNENSGKQHEIGSPVHFSLTRKGRAVLRIDRGDALEAIARDLGIDMTQLLEWQEAMNTPRARDEAGPALPASVYNGSGRRPAPGTHSGT